MDTKLFIVVPCYNEEQVLPITSNLFLEELLELIRKNKVSDDSRVFLWMMGVKIRHGM